MPQQPIIPEIAYADPWRLYPKIAPYNPSDLVGRKGYRIFRIMLKDEQVKAALAFKKHSALASGWRVKPPEGEDEALESRVFVDRVLNGLLCGMNCALKNMLSMLEWGFSVSELIWESSEGELRIVNLKTRHPAHIQFLQDVHGNILEVQQQAPTGLIVIPEPKIVVLSNDDNFSNPYGTSDLESAYRAWWSKEQAYRWLAMLLEKFGIPPVFAMYNPNRYQGQILTGLKGVLSGMQASTVGLVPRNAKDDIEMWAPSLADNVGDVFLPALDRYDRDISRAILIPNLLGITPEETTGSQARAATIFDGFLFVVERLRQQLADAVNVKIVKPLVDLNFGGDIYPVFEFIPISDDKRIGLLDVWQRLVSAGAVTRTDTDQQHIRAILEFPEASSAIEEEEEEDVEEEDLLDQSFVHEEDFAAIEKTLDSIESAFVDDAAAEIEKRVSRIEKLIPKLGLADIPRLKFTFGIKAPLRALIFGAFDSGSIIKQFQELPKVVPRDAVRALRAKVLIMETTANADILKVIKQVLLTGLETGATTQDVIAALRTALQPWIGSPQLLDGKPVPKGRLETIARSESTSAFNTGRLISGRKLGSLIQAFRFDAVLDTRTCFATGTMVHLSNGATKPIEQVTPGDRVLSGRGVPRRVKAVKLAIGHRWVELSAGSDRKLRATFNHPFWSLRSGDYGWVEAREIETGDRLGTISMRELRQAMPELCNASEEVLQPRVLLGAEVQDDLARSRMRLVQEAVPCEEDIRGARPDVSYTLQSRVQGSAQQERAEQGRVDEGMRDMRKGFFGKAARSHGSKAQAPLFERMSEATRVSKVPDVQGTVPNPVRIPATLLQQGVLSAVRRGNHVRAASQGGTGCTWDPIPSGSGGGAVQPGLSGERDAGDRDRRRILASESRGIRCKEGSRDQETALAIFTIDGSEGGRPAASGFAEGINHDAVPSPDGYVVVTSVSHFDSLDVCYDLEVDGDHTYVVEGGIIVHNSEVCQFLDGMLFKAGDSDLDALSPALHPNCRSILTPLSISQELDEADFITPRDVGRAKELAAAGFAGVKSI